MFAWDKWTFFLLAAAFGLLIAACSEPLEISGTASVTTGRVPLSVIFTHDAANAERIRWDFNDGTILDVLPSDPPVEHVFTTAGTHEVTLTAVESDGRRTDPVTVTITAFPGTLDSIILQPADVTLGVGEASRFTVTGFDGFGNRIQESSVRFLTAPDAGRIDENGNYTAGTKAGLYQDAVTVEVSQGATIKTASASVSIEPGPLHHVTFDRPGIEVEAGEGFQVRAVAFDQFDNPLADVPIAYAASEDAATVAGDGSFVAGHDLGTYQKAVTAQASQGPLTATGESDLTILPGPLDHIEIAPPSLETAVADRVVFTVKAFDRFNHPLDRLTAEFSADENAGRIDDRGMFVAGTTAGTFPGAITAAVRQGAVTKKASVDVSLRSGPLDRVIIEPNSASMRVAGELNFSAAAFDEYGNAVSGLGVEFTADASAGAIDESGRFTAAAKPGLYQQAITASVTQGDVTRTSHADVRIDHGTLRRIAMTPASAAVQVGRNMRFTVAAFDQFDNPITTELTTVYSANREAGEIGSDGVFTAGIKSGQYDEAVTVQVSHGPDSLTMSAGVTVLPGPIHAVEISPAHVELGPNDPHQFRAAVTDAFGNLITDAQVTWGVDGEVGAIDEAGLLTPTFAAGTYTNSVTATAVLDGATASNTATVTVAPGPLERISTPERVSVVVGESIQLPSLTAFDSHGNALSGVEITWEMETDRAGAVSPTGLFEAGAVVGVFPNAIGATASQGERFRKVTANVTILPGPLDRVVVTPVAGELIAGASQQFSARAVDRFGNDLAGIDINWTADPAAGTITAGGLFTAGETSAVFDRAITATATQGNLNRRVSASIDIRQVFTVNSSDNSDDKACDKSHCSLLEAINAANSSPGLEGIRFDLASSSQTITPRFQLPTITDAVIIDGTTEPGYNGTPVITLDGTDTTGQASGFVLSGRGITIKGFAIIRFAGSGILVNESGSNVIESNFIGVTTNGTSTGANGVGISIESSSENRIGGQGSGNVISGNGSGIVVGGQDSTGNIVMGNLIGTDASGQVDLGNANFGIWLRNAPDNVIGAATLSNRNVISGNNIDGINVSGEFATGNVVLGNLIGTDMTGAKAMGNSIAGVSISSGASNNVIGGGLAGSGNVISANGNFGIWIRDPATTNNTIIGNFIGTALNGADRLGNGVDGVLISNGARQNTIGGTNPGAGNVISGNTAAGIRMTQSAQANHIVGNLIGTDVSGRKPLGNTDGVVISDAINNAVGGTATGERNVISGNTSAGIRINHSRAADNTAQGNFIGTGVNGATKLGNNNGVVISAGNNNTIGGRYTGAANLISGNNASGIEIAGPLASANSVVGNLIGPDVTGTRSLGNSGSGIVINGASGNTIGGSRPRSGNVISGNGGTGVTITSVNSTGNVIAGNLVGTDVTGLIALGNASGGIKIDGARANVIGGFDSGAGNVISGNQGSGVEITGKSADSNAIRGNIIGAGADGSTAVPNKGSGVVVSAAPGNMIGGTSSGSRNVISGNGENGVIIVGSSAGGNVVQANYIGTNADGTSALGNAGSGVVINQAPSTLLGGSSGAARNVISANGAHGVSITGAAATGNRVLGNYIGTDQTGKVALGNTGSGIEIAGAPSNNVGGSGSDSRNIISGNKAHGINIAGTGATGNRISANYIGIDRTGAQILGNQGAGIVLDNAPDNTIGDPASASANVISGNRQGGIRITGGGANRNVVVNNLIGVNPDGRAALGNTGSGIVIQDGKDNQVGANDPSLRNVISGNTGSGIEIIGSGASGNRIQSNTIGADVSGQTGLGNLGDGVRITDASGNKIGGTSTARNLISGNTGSGVVVTGKTASSNVIQGNYIGTDTKGVRQLGNAGYGVLVVNSPASMIGGDAALLGNLISGNQAGGIRLVGSDTRSSVVQGNMIGTDWTGRGEIGNVGPGIQISNAPNNAVGGLSEGSRNIISGNTGNGLEIVGAEAKGNVAQNNLIGAAVGGANPLGNGGSGVLILNAPNNTIGGKASESGNVISGNAKHGVVVSGSASAENVIQSNFIGAGSDGVTAIPNGGDGVHVSESASVNTIGSQAVRAGSIIPTVANVIAFNDGGGVTVESGVRNSVQRNSIFENSGPGIDLGADGPTPNDSQDADTGANNLQNYPSISSLEIDAKGDLVVVFDISSAQTNAAYPVVVDFYQADSAPGGEGRRFLGTTTDVQPSATLGPERASLGRAADIGVSAGDFVVAAATDAQGNTSEFTASIVVTQSR